MDSIKSKRTEAGDAENTGFGLPIRLAEHKPGFEKASSKPEADTGDSHRLRPSKKKDVPQRSLAERITEIRGGG